MRNNSPTAEDVKILNGWPEGTLGYNSEQEMIETIRQLCVKHGFGRVPQIAQWIEEIWRDPTQLEHYKVLRESRMAMFEKQRK